MNNSFFRASILTLLSITILLMSCQNESQYFIDSNNLNSSNSHYIAKGKAIKIADMVLGYDCDTRTVEHQPNIDYDVTSDYEDFDIEEITRCLDSFNLIYIVGTDYLAGKGHAWVSDGCHYCVDEEDESIIIDTYIHCDWGWGGVGNGYYSGNVFSVKSSMFIPEYYFAVRDETVSLTPPL